MNQFYVTNACPKTQCPEKYICVNKTCKIIDQKPHCYECLNKEHIGKNNVVQHLKEFIDLDKFMEQINIKIQQKDTLLSQIIEQCQNYQRDTLQQISQGSQLSQINIKIQNIFKEKQEFIEVLKNAMEKNKQFTKYSLEHHEQLNIIFHENNQNDLEIYKKRLSQLKEDVENFLEDIHQGSSLSQKKLTETIKILQYQSNKNTFHHYIFTFTIAVLILLSVNQYLKQPEKSDHECMNLKMEFDALRSSNQIDSDKFQSKFETLKRDYEKVQNKLKNLEIQFEFFKEKNQEKKNDNIQRFVGEIHQNLKIEELKDFSLIYDYHFTKGFSPQAREKLVKFVFRDQRNPVICIGGVAEKNLNEFILVGCDYATEVFKITTDTKVARKSPNGDIYWYWVDKKSFGFAPTSKINLNASDREDLPNERRFSYWYNLGKDGGQRIGKFTSLLNSSNYRMRIYMFEQ